MLKCSGTLHINSAVRGSIFKRSVFIFLRCSVMRLPHTIMFDVPILRCVIGHFLHRVQMLPTNFLKIAASIALVFSLFFLCGVELLPDGNNRTNFRTHLRPNVQSAKQLLSRMQLKYLLQRKERGLLKNLVGFRPCLCL